MDELASILFRFLLDWSIRFGMLILGLWIWFWLRPPASVYTRLFLGHLVLFAGLALPMTPRWWSLPWPVRVEADALPVPRGVLPAEESAQAEPNGAPSRTMIAPIPSRSVETPQGEDKQPVSLLAQTVPLETPQPENPHPQPSHTTTPSWIVILLGAWALGAGFFLVRIAAGFWWLGRIKRNAQFPSHQLLEEWEEARKELKVTRQVPLCNSPWVATPTLLGGWNPMVAIPLDWECESPENRRAGFLHEWAHIQHRDDWAKLRDELVRAWFFFHPLVHWLLNQLGLGRELRCDVLATRHGVNERNLAQFLFAQVKKLGSGQTGLLSGNALSFLQIRSAKERIQQLLEADMGRWGAKVSWVQGAMAALAVWGLAIGLGGLSQASPGAGLPAIAPISGGPENGEVTETPFPDSIDATPQPTEGSAPLHITVKVLLPGGRPAQGAKVWCDLVELGPLQTLEEISDTHGQVTFFLREGARYRFGSTLEEMGGEALNEKGLSIWTVDSKQRDAIPVRLEERGTTRGRLLATENETPLSGARVTLDNGRVAVTDDQGRWVVKGLKRGPHKGVVSCPNRARMAFQFDTTQPWETELLLRVPQAVIARGTVVDEQGKPIPGAWVGAMTPGSVGAKGTVEGCDKNGRFTYPVIADQSVELLAGAPGFFLASREGWVDPINPKEWEIRLNKRTTETGHQKRLPLANRLISGKVADPSGQPASGITLLWCPASSWEKESHQTDSQGEFRIPTIDEEGVLALIPKEWEPLVFPVGKGAIPTIQASLKPGRTIAAKVIDEKGHPVSGVHVTIGTNKSPLVWLASKNQVTNDQGFFSMRGVPEDGQILCWKEGWEDWTGAISGARTPTIKMKRVAGPEFGVIKGRVVDPEGKPIPHFQVSVSPSYPLNPGEKRGISNHPGGPVSVSHPGGKFLIQGLEMGYPFQVTVHSANHGPARVERVMPVSLVHPDSGQETLLRAEPTSPLQVKVLDASGKPIEGARVLAVETTQLHGKLTQWFQLPTDSLRQKLQRTNRQGVVHWEGLPFSRGTILVDASGYGRGKIIWNGKMSQVEVVLRPEAKLVLSYNGPFESNRAIPGEWVSSQGDILLFSLSQGEGGRKTFDGLYEGEWTLTLGTDGDPPLVKETLRLKSGQTTILSKKIDKETKRKYFLTK